MATQTRVLVVDDEVPIARLVRDYLAKDGFDVYVSHDGPGALRTAKELAPDVVILDLGLPGLDGIEVCRRLRTFSDCYVIMLTARSDEVDKLIGLSVGADDYLTKPFSPRELVARVHVILRRSRPTGGSENPEQVLEFGPLRVSISAREVRIGATSADLTRIEFDLLVVLATRPRQVFTRRQLIDAVWGADWMGDERLVDVHIGHLRRKLGDESKAVQLIRTVRGVGYRMAGVE
jgi:DNA-binding response OmpR family regulator